MNYWTFGRSKNSLSEPVRDGRKPRKWKKKSAVLNNAEGSLKIEMISIENWIKMLRNTVMRQEITGDSVNETYTVD